MQVFFGFFGIYTNICLIIENVRQKKMDEREDIHVPDEFTAWKEKKENTTGNVEKLTESHENLHSLLQITLKRACLYHKKYKKQKKNTAQEIDKKKQLC